MNNLQLHIVNYLSHCEHQKRLDSKTLKAYRIDLGQFSKSTGITDPIDVSSNILEIYISTLHEKYKPKTVKRKIASLKAFFHYLEYREVVILNPFNIYNLHLSQASPNCLSAKKCLTGCSYH